MLFNPQLALDNIISILIYCPLVLFICSSFINLSDTNKLANICYEPPMS